jgi:hypothetical protein
MDYQHTLALVKTVYRANQYTISVLAFDAGLRHDVGHTNSAVDLRDELALKIRRYVAECKKLSVSAGRERTLVTDIENTSRKMPSASCQPELLGARRPTRLNHCEELTIRARA